jgi:hypothetical protein
MKRAIPFSLVVFFFFAANSSAEPIEKMSRLLSRGVSGLSSKKVAILSFPYHDSKLSSGSSIVAEHVLTSLVGKKGIQVVERRLVSKILEEQIRD